MKTALILPLILVCAAMNGQTGRGIIRPSLLEITETASAFDAKVKEAYKDYPLPDSLSSDYHQLFDELDLEEINFGEYNESRDIAERRWDRFIGLCRKYSYGEALDCYLEDFADFFVYLKISDDRYEFLSSILLPLMKECRGEEFARRRYIEDLTFEKTNEEFIIAIDEDGEGYVPEVYSDVVRDLGQALAEDGRLDEALALAEDLVKSADLCGEDGLAEGINYILTLFKEFGDTADKDKCAAAIRELVRTYGGFAPEDEGKVINDFYELLSELEV